MTIEVLKYQIFTKIMNIQDEAALEHIKKILEDISKENDIFNRTIKPIKEKTTVEELIKEQNYRGFDRKAFDQLIVELDIDDPIEELLALSKS